MSPIEIMILPLAASCLMSKSPLAMIAWSIMLVGAMAFAPRTWWEPIHVPTVDTVDTDTDSGGAE